MTQFFYKLLITKQSKKIQYNPKNITTM